MERILFPDGDAKLLAKIAKALEDAHIDATILSGDEGSGFIVNIPESCNETAGVILAAVQLQQ